MGVVICAVFEREIPQHGTLGGDNPALNRDWQRLAKLAKAAKLRPLNDFESYDAEEVAASLDMDPEELGLDTGNMPAAQWFAAADGLAAVQALVAHLRANPKLLSRQAEVLDELSGVETELSAAEKAGVRFRFEAVM
jgi:hypothetical protein